MRSCFSAGNMVKKRSSTGTAGKKASRAASRLTNASCAARNGKNRTEECPLHQSRDRIPRTGRDQNFPDKVIVVAVRDRARDCHLLVPHAPRQPSATRR